MDRHPRARPSDTAGLPAGVADPLLWRVAYDVAAAHQPGADGRCLNWQCTNLAPGECAVAADAHRALQLACPGWSPHPEPKPAPAGPSAPVYAGQRQVPKVADLPGTRDWANRFPGWFTPRSAEAPPASGESGRWAKPKQRNLASSWRRAFPAAGTKPEIAEAQHRTGVRTFVWRPYRPPCSTPRRRERAERPPGPRAHAAYARSA